MIIPIPSFDFAGMISEARRWRRWQQYRWEVIALDSSAFLPLDPDSLIHAGGPFQDSEIRVVRVEFYKDHVFSIELG